MLAFFYPYVSFSDDSTPDRISRETCGHPGEVPGAQIFGDNFSHGNEVSINPAFKRFGLSDATNFSTHLDTM